VAWAGETVTFVFTSDVHFGINRGNFRGSANVEARVVSAAMVETINALPAITLPRDAGLHAGRAVGPVDFVAPEARIHSPGSSMWRRMAASASGWISPLKTCHSASACV
jgi:hypothetical protein